MKQQTKFEVALDRTMIGSASLATELVFQRALGTTSPPVGQQKPVWYLMDWYGLALAHSDQPNFLCKPFANAVTGKVVSLVWPVREVGEGDVCTRDFVPLLHSGESQEQRAARRDAILNFDSMR